MYVKRLTESPTLALVQSARWAGSCCQSLHVQDRVFISSKVHTSRPHYAKNVLFAIA